ncbi:MAG TPA: CAP domain-containing protein [Candidatus Limnocylindria bacterium]|nr:CAP domain-containing protein [Candidatus Limnocylindria bacterium]
MRHLPRQAALSIIGAVLLVALVILFAPAPSGPTARATPTVTAPAGGPPSAPAAAATTSAAPAATAPASNDAAAMLRAHNDLRAATGAPPVRSDDRVSAAAQRHAEYLVRNATGGHAETPGQPGFSGANVRDRLAAQGYDAPAASEVATSAAGTDGVRSLWVMPYHRLGLMHPHAIVAGWGYAESGGRRATVGVIVYDFASPAPEVVRSPGSGQREATLQWDGREDADVAPGAPRPLGYTVMAVWSRARAVTLRGSSITAGGRAIEHAVAPQIYERDYVAIVPLAPLASGTRYRVRLDVTVAGVDATEEWEFETGR